MDATMKNVYTFFMIVYAGIIFTQVSGKDARLLWSVDEQSTSQSCIYSISGDPTDWVPNLSVDDQYEVIVDPTCVDRTLIQVGPLTVNPVIPDVVLSTDKLDNGLLYFEATHEGDVQIFFGGSSNVTGIAFDYQSQNVYFTDPELGLVLVEYAKSRPYFTILLEGLNDPHGVIVDPDQGYIFWAEASVLKRSSLTGESVVELLDGLSRSSYLALDTSAQKLFILDEEAGSLRSISYDGQSVVFLIDDTTNITSGKFSGIAADQGYIFATLAAEATIVIWDQATGTRQAELGMSVNQATQHGITVTSLDPEHIRGACKTNKGGCSHICVHQSGNSRKCLCSMGYTLQNDGVSCASGYLTNHFLLVSDIGADKLYQIGLTSSAVHGIPVERTNNQRMESLVYDPKYHQVVWMDTGNGTLRSKILSGDSTERVIFTFANDSGSVVEGITFNSVDRYVYYSDIGLSKIGRIALDSGEQEIIWNLPLEEKPLQIQVDGVNGYIYWTNIGTPASIERATLDGNGRNTLVSTDIQKPTGLIINIAKNQVYWADETLGRLEKINMDGTEREMIQAVDTVYSIAIDNNFVYIAKPHHVRRYSIAEQPQSTLGPKEFSLLYGLHLYSTETTDKLTTTTPGSSDASMATGVLQNAIIASWFVLWTSKMV